MYVPGCCKLFGLNFLFAALEALNRLQLKIIRADKSLNKLLLHCNLITYFDSQFMFCTYLLPRAWYESFTSTFKAVPPFAAALIMSFLRRSELSLPS